MLQQAEQGLDGSTCSLSMLRQPISMPASLSMAGRGIQHTPTLAPHPLSTAPAARRHQRRQRVLRALLQEQVSLACPVQA